MRTRFKISKNDTIKAFVHANNKLLASVYDSGFTTINEVVNRLISKIPYTNSKKLEISIHNNDKEQSKYITKKVNR